MRVFLPLKDSSSSSAGPSNNSSKPTSKVHSSADAESASANHAPSSGDPSDEAVKGGAGREGARSAATSSLSKPEDAEEPSASVTAPFGESSAAGGKATAAAETAAKLDNNPSDRKQSWSSNTNSRAATASSSRGPTTAAASLGRSSSNSCKPAVASFDKKRKLGEKPFTSSSSSDVKVGPVAKVPKKGQHQQPHAASSSPSSYCDGTSSSSFSVTAAASTTSGAHHGSWRTTNMVSHPDNKRPPQQKARRGGSGARSPENSASASASASSSLNNNPLRERERYEYNPFERPPAFLSRGEEPLDDYDDENEPTVSVTAKRPTKKKGGGGQEDEAAERRTVEAFREGLKSTMGLDLVEQEGDGNCLFRAIALQVYGDAGMHGEIRRRCMDFMGKDEEHYAQFITEEPFQDYVERKRRDGVHGNHIEIQAISELYNRPVEVFVPDNGPKPINIFHSEYKTEDVPIRLSYHDGNHYNAVIDPLCPTAGLGLGLPGLQPGLADEMQLKEACAESDRLAFVENVEKAVEESDKLQIERALRESAQDNCLDQSSLDQMYRQKALALSDLEATDFELEQAVINSSMESYQNLEGCRKQPSWLSRGGGVAGRNARGFDSYGYGVTNSSSRASPPYHPSHRAAAAASSSTPSRAAAAGVNDVSSPSFALEGDEYPQTVQELVVNGFELSKVLKAYELIGDNFDDLLAFLMNSGAGT